MTNDAPRTIWADSPQVFDDCDVWQSEPAEGRTEYIRADIAQAEKEAAVAAEREACVSRLESLKDTAYQNNLLAEGVTYSCAIDAIRARANTDPLAERDARVRAEAMREAAEAVASAGYYCVPPYDETGDLSFQIDHSKEAILALIPAEQEGSG